MTETLARNLIQRIAVGDIVRRTSRRVPHKVALVERVGNRRRTLTYADLHRMTNQLAHAMLRLGLRPRDRIGSLCGNSLEFAVTIYGLAKAGLVWVPVNPGLAPEDVNYILRHAEVKAVFVDDAYYGLYERTGFVPEIPPVLIKATGTSVPENLEVWEKLVTSAPDTEVEVEIWDRDLCQIMYTSGTTAAPKGVMTSHLAVFVASLNNIIELNITRDSVISCLMPLFHCAQHTFLTSVLHAGGAAVIMRGFEVGELVRAIHEERITWLFALPGMYRALLDYPERSRFDLSSLRTCLYAMTPMDRRTLTEAIEQLGAEFCLGTGQTECYPSTNNFKPEWQLKKEGNYWGESALTLETAVVDDEGHLLPPGQVGEIVWRGPTVMEGYLKDEAATAESRKFGWHHSGDLGYFDEDGLLVFVDRKKDMIKTGGENVPSIKVERVILADPRVAACAVVGLPHARWIEAVTAFVVPQPGSGLRPEDVIALCRDKLGRFEVPKRVVLVEDLPRTSTGKVQKHVLRDRYRELYRDETD